MVNHIQFSLGPKPSPVKNGSGRVYERGKAPAPPPPVSARISSYTNIPYNNLHNTNENTTTDAVSNNNSKPKAIVVYDYTKKDNQEMSLGKSQIVTVLESKKGSEWWKVQDNIGRQGYYPSHYLKVI